MKRDRIPLMHNQLHLIQRNGFRLNNLASFQRIIIRYKLIARIVYHCDFSLVQTAEYGIRQVKYHFDRFSSGFCVRFYPFGQRRTS